MSYEVFRRSPVYHQALMTPDIMSRNPLGNGLVSPEIAGDIKICEAGLRLDHLIRNSLNPSYFKDFPSIDHLSAMKFFVDKINCRIRSIPITDKTRIFIEPRLQLCQEILARANVDLIENGYDPVSSDDFNQIILTNGQNAEAMVFNNPFAGKITSWSHSPSYDAFTYYWK